VHSLIVHTRVMPTLLLTVSALTPSTALRADPAPAKHPSGLPQVGEGEPGVSSPCVACGRGKAKDPTGKRVDMRGESQDSSCNFF